MSERTLNRRRAPGVSFAVLDRAMDWWFDEEAVDAREPGTDNRSESNSHTTTAGVRLIG